MGWDDEKVVYRNKNKSFFLEEIERKKKMKGEK
jgi:hypothetical protein